MGYRSNIRCLIYPKPSLGSKSTEAAYGALKTIMNTTFKDLLVMWETCIKFDDKNQLFDFEIDDVKWYDSFPDVIAFNEMLPEIEELGFCYEFIRVGEDDDDIETRYSTTHRYYLGTTTSITCYI